MTTLMQAHEQWAKRPADERFVSLHEMQAKMRSLRDRSEADVQSTRKIEVLPDETDPRHRGLMIGIGQRTARRPLDGADALVLRPALFSGVAG